MKKQLLIVDGYNMIGAWPDLQQYKKRNLLEEAREQLLRQLSEYAKYKKIEVIVVFDAQLVPGIQKTYDKYLLEVVFTSTDETADTYIEALTRARLNPLTQVTVATSDLAEQWYVFSVGALRKSANELYKDIHKTKKEIKQHAESYHYENYRRNSPWRNDQLAQLKQTMEKLQDK